VYLTSHNLTVAMLRPCTPVDATSCSVPVNNQGRCMCHTNTAVTCCLLLLFTAWIQRPTNATTPSFNHCRTHCSGHSHELPSAWQHAVFTAAGEDTADDDQSCASDCNTCATKESCSASQSSCCWAGSPGGARCVAASSVHYLSDPYNCGSCGNVSAGPCTAEVSGRVSLWQGDLRS
jgi:hypothetical protein